MTNDRPVNWEWLPLWHDRGESLIEFIEFLRSQEETLNEDHIRNLWIGAAMHIMEALYFDLSLARSIGDIEDGTGG